MGTFWDWLGHSGTLRELWEIISRLTGMWAVGTLFLLIVFGALGVAWFIRRLVWVLAPLILVFDQNDDECRREWPEDRHTLFRVRLRCRWKTARNVGVTVVNISPSVLDVSGAISSFRHNEDVEDNRVLVPGRSWYADIVEYNARDANTGQPVLFLYTKRPQSPLTPLPARTCTLMLSAYGDGIRSVRRRFTFAVDDSGYRFGRAKRC